MNADDEFASQARAERLTAGLTQEQVVAGMRQLGFSKFHQATVFKIEAGQRKVSVGEAFAIAQVLGVPLGSLLPSESVNSHVRDRSELARQLQANKQLIERAIELYGNVPSDG